MGNYLDEGKDMGVLGGSRNTAEHPGGIPDGCEARPTPPVYPLFLAIFKEPIVLMF